MQFLSSFFVLIFSIIADVYTLCKFEKQNRSYSNTLLSLIFFYKYIMILEQIYEYVEGLSFISKGLCRSKASNQKYC